MLNHIVVGWGFDLVSDFGNIISAVVIYLQYFTALPISLTTVTYIFSTSFISNIQHLPKHNTFKLTDILSLQKLRIM